MVHDARTHETRIIDDSGARRSKRNCVILSRNNGEESPNATISHFEILRRLRGSG